MTISIYKMNDLVDTDAINRINEISENLKTEISLERLTELYDIVSGILLKLNTVEENDSGSQSDEVESQSDEVEDIMKLSSMTCKELRAICKKRGLRRYSKATKETLLKMLGDKFE